MFANTFGNHKKVECGLVCILKRKHDEYGPDVTAPVPLQSVCIQASIVHAVAQVELTQIFVNKEEQPIEAIYFFPVDSNGGVTHFHAEIEGRTIKGIVKPQEEAKAQYDKAVAENQTAFLVDSNKPDIFKVRIGFLKPGAQVKVVIGYVTEVKNEKGSHAQRLFIPTTVAPRYVPDEDTDEKSVELKTMKFSETSPAPLTITVNVSLQGGIKLIDSPTHKVTVTEMGPVPEKPNWTRVIVNLSGNTTDMDRDFVLLITPDEVHTPRLYAEEFEKSTALMTHLIPSFNLDDRKVELIFILDRSGSMMGQSIELAKRALTLFLHSAPVDCHFNIVGFGSTFEFLFPESVKYDDGSLKKAAAHAKSLQANLGGTELLQPLKEVFNKKLIPGYLRQIFVLTDGEISNTDAVLGLTKANSHLGRLFSLGVGDSCSHHLVEGLAEAGGGTSSFVTYNESIDSKVLQQLKNAIQPSLSDVSVEWIGVSESEPVQSKFAKLSTVKSLLGYGKPVETSQDVETKKVYNQAPEKVPPIYDGSQLLVFGLFETTVPTGVNIKAESPDGPLSVQIQFDQSNNLGSNGMIHKLAAIKLVRELEMKVASYNIGYSANHDDTVEALKNEIIAISCQHGISSKYTSFVAVDTGDQKTDENWVMQTRHVPSQYAHGWNGGYGRQLMAPCSMPMSSGVAVMNRMPAVRGLRNTAANYSTSSLKRKASIYRSCRKFRSSNDITYSINMHNNYVQSDSESEEDEEVETDSENSSHSDSKRLRMSPSSSCSEKLVISSDASDSESDSMNSEEEESCTTSKMATPEDHMHALVATQSFNGSVTLSDEFASSIGQKLEDLKKEAQNLSFDEGAFATALALAFLTETLNDLKDSWELVEGKAKKWLVNNFSDVHADILTAATKFVKRIAQN